MLKALFKPVVIIPLLLSAIAVLLAGSFFLFHKAYQFYQREAEVRLEPIDDRYANANAKVIGEAKERPRIIIFGESRAGMWRAHPPGDAWGDVEIINRGIGGETTAQIRLRLEEDVLALDPDLVILQMGDNDLKTMAILPKRKDRIIADTERNIRYIAETIGKRGIDVVLTTIFPTGPISLLRKPVWSDEVNESIDVVNQRLLELNAPNVTVVECDAFLRGEGQYIKPEYSLDTLHLTAEGYAALNKHLAPIIKSALQDELPAAD